MKKSDKTNRNFSYYLFFHYSKLVLTFGHCWEKSVLRVGMPQKKQQKMY